MRLTYSVPFGLAVLGGCASIPDTTVTYYLPQSVTVITVQHAIACNAALSSFSVASTPVAVTTASADTAAPATLPTKAFKNAFGSSDLVLTLRDDGRIAGITSESTGAGKEVVKLVLDMAAGPAADDEGKAQQFTPEDVCKLVNKYGNDDVITFSESTSITAPARSDATFAPDLNTQLFRTRFGALAPLLPKSTLRLGESKHVHQFPPFDDTAGPAIKLRGTDRVPVTVRVRAFNEQALVYKADLTVPSAQLVGVPIPGTPVFGTSNFELEVAEVGTVTKLRYGAKDGATDGLGAAAGLLAAARGPSVSEQVADVNAQADLIVATQRLAQCRVKPTECK